MPASPTVATPTSVIVTDELEYLTADLTGWLGARIVEGHSAQSAAIALSLVHGLAAGSTSESAAFLRQHERQAKRARLSKLDA